MATLTNTAKTANASLSNLFKATGTESYLLLQSGDYLLLQNGDQIIIAQGGGTLTNLAKS